MEVFPKSFWINSQQNAGRDYVVIQNNGGALQCDCDGKASVSQGQITQSNYFIAEKIGGKVVALRSYYGGYLAIHADGSVDCADHTICEENNFQVILSSYDCAQDAPNYALLRVISGSYLSISNGQVSSVKNVDETIVFKGYLYDASTSICKQPVVTVTPPTETSSQCHEVEIEVPVKRKHKKKAKKAQEEELITTTTVQHRKIKPKKKVKSCECEDEDYDCDYDNDHDEGHYETVEDSSKSRKHRNKRKHSRKAKIADSDLYDSNDVYVVDHNKDGVGVVQGESSSCESKEGSKIYTLADDDAKKCD
jgi:hypothetical protein